jgi:membrane-associated protein
MEPAAHRSSPRLTALGVTGPLVAATATLLVVAGIVPLPDLDRALEEASRTLGGWAYPAVAGFAFVETAAFVGLVAPGETAVVVGGVVAARGEVELLPLIGLVWLAAWAGDLVSFLLGRRLGRPFIVRHGPRLRLGPERLARVERFYARHGGKAVLLGRFAGLVRAVSPFLAGASGLTLRRFLPWSAGGALAWAATFTLVGYGFSESFAESGDTAARIALAIAALAAAGYVVAVLLRSRSHRRGRGPQPGEAQRHDRAQRTKNGAEGRPGNHIEREVHPQIDPRHRDGGGDRQRRRTQARTQDGHGRGRVEGGRAVPGGERGVIGDGGERTEPRISYGRRSRANASLRTWVTTDAAPVAAGAAPKATGMRLRQRSEHRPSARSKGPLTHHAENTTKRAVSQGCSKAGAASTSARSRSSRGAIAETSGTLARRVGSLLR